MRYKRYTAHMKGCGEFQYWHSERGDHLGEASRDAYTTWLSEVMLRLLRDTTADDGLTVFLKRYFPVYYLIPGTR